MQQDELAEFQRWYEEQCDGDWEHSFGVRIDTLDNPGWSVEIDLAGTPLVGRAFPSVRNTAPAHEWLFCEVSGQTFRGAGGPLMLRRMLRVFLDWAHEAQRGSALPEP